MKNRPKDSIITLEKLESLYNRVSPYLTDDQKEYIKGILDGRQDVDTMYEMKLLVRQMSIIFSEGAIWYLTEKRVDEKLAKFADSLRAAIKDLHDMSLKDEERRAKTQETNDLVRITERRGAMERVEALLSEHPSE